MATCRGLRLWCSLIIAIIFLSSTFPANCGRMQYWDLDSMVMMSVGVVEGTIVAEGKRSQDKYTELKVEKIYKGPFKKGERIKLSGMHTYRKYIDERYPFGKHVPLANPDRIVVFLTTDEWNPKPPGVYEPVSLGVRLISNGKAIHFAQKGNPGPVVLQDDERSSKYWIDAEQYREDVEKSVEKVKPIEKKLNSELTEKDADWLMDLLDERSPEDPNYPYYIDHISRTACARIAEFQNAKISARALEHVNAWSKGEDTIKRSFRTPEGRELLLKIISDPKELMEKRITYAGVLSSAGDSYHLTYDVRKDGDCGRLKGERKDGNAGYITRIARLALENAEHEEFCTALLDSIRSFSRKISQRKEEHTTADMLAAIPILEKAYKLVKSDIAKLKIELTFGYMDKPALERINPDCGPVIAFIKELELRLKDEDTQCLFITYTAHDFADKPIELAPYFVLKHTTSNTKYRLSFRDHLWKSKDNGPPIPGGDRIRYKDDIHSFDGKSSVCMGRLIVLPKDLPAGKYRVHIEYRDGDKVISKGHHKELEI